MNHYNSLWNNTNTSKLLKCNEPGSPRSNRRRKKAQFDLTRANRVNTANPKLCTQHIGQCHDKHHHRGCIYNIIDEDVNTTSFTDIDIESWDTTSLKQRLSESESERIKLQNALSRCKTKLRMVLLENEKSRDAAKSLKTMAGVIHNLETKIQANIQDKDISDALYEKEAEHLNTELQEYKRKYQNLMVDYEALKKESDSKERRPEFRVPMVLSPKFMQVQTDPVSIDDDNEAKIEGLVWELKELRSKNTDLSVQLAKLRNHDNQEIAKLKKENERLIEETKRVSIENAQDKLSHFVEGQRNDSYKSWADKQEIESLKKQNVKYSKELAKLRTTKRDEKRKYNLKMKSLQEYIDQLENDLAERLKIDSNGSGADKHLKQVNKTLGRKLAEIRVQHMNLKKKFEKTVGDLKSKISELSRTSVSTIESPETPGNDEHVLRLECAKLKEELARKNDTISDLKYEYKISVQGMEEGIMKLADDLVKSDTETKEESSEFQSFEYEYDLLKTLNKERS